MNINLVHPSLNNYGGAELVCMEMIRTIKKSSHDACLFTIDKVNWRQLIEHMGQYPIPDEQIYLYEENPNFKNPFLKWVFLTYSYLNILIKAKKRQTMTINNYGEVFPIVADLSYVHSVPLFSIYKHGKHNPYQIPFWAITSKLYYLLFSLLRKFLKESVIITNSRYNAKIIEKFTRNQPLIIYPPVNLSNFNPEPSEKDHTILTVSRIRSVKNLSIIPRIARKTRIKRRFLLLGRADHRSGAVLDEIMNDATGVEEVENLHIVLNPNRATILRALSKASIYLSTQPTEAFGIAIVEAMARGCVPIVPRNGGPWLDILDEEQGLYGFAYGDPGEAAFLIDTVLSDNELRKEVATRAQDRALLYESTRFRREFARLLDAVSNRFQEK